MNVDIDTMTWRDLPEFENQRIMIFGVDENAIALANHIRDKFPSIRLDCFLNDKCGCQRLLGLDVLSLDEARKRDMLDGANILVAQTPIPASNLFITVDIRPFLKGGDSHRKRL